MRRFLLLIGTLVLFGAIGAGIYLGGVAPVATGYAARIGCSFVHLQGQPVADLEPELPPNPLVPYLRPTADERGVSVTLLGLWESRAIITDTGGCQQIDPSDDDPPLDALEVEYGADDVTIPTDLDAAAVTAGFDPAALAATLDAAFEEDADPLTEVGTRAIAVLADGVLIAEQYAAPFDADTPLLGWSMTKSVADALTGRLVELGVVDTSDTNLREDWADDDRSEISVQHLLTMTDGLQFDEVYEVDTDATQMLFTVRGAGDFAAEKPLADPPGTRWEYSSGTTNILCTMLGNRAEDAGIAGRSVMLTDLLFGPLAMTSATVGTDVTNTPVCSSFGYATARDWARFGQFYLQDGVWGGERLLPFGWVAASTTPVAADRQSPRRVARRGPVS